MWYYTLCQKRLSANHISISTHFRIRLAISSRKTENLSLDAALQSHQWLGGHPYGRTWTHIKMYSALWTGRNYYPTVSYKFSFFPRTVADWNYLPSSARSTPSLNSFKTVLHRLSASPIVITEPCHSNSKGCTVHTHGWIFSEELKNWRISFKWNYEKKLLSFW